MDEVLPITHIINQKLKRDQRKKKKKTTTHIWVGWWYEWEDATAHGPQSSPPIEAKMERSSGGGFGIFAAVSSQLFLSTTLRRSRRVRAACLHPARAVPVAMALRSPELRWLGSLTRPGRLAPSPLAALASPRRRRRAPSPSQPPSSPSPSPSDSSTPSTAPASAGKSPLRRSRCRSSGDGQMLPPKGLLFFIWWALGILCRCAGSGGVGRAGVEEGQCQAVRDQGVHDPRRGLERTTPPPQQRCVPHPDDTASVLVCCCACAWSWNVIVGVGFQSEILRLN
jgi:hypothetical protein